MRHVEIKAGGECIERLSSSLNFFCGVPARCCCRLRLSVTKKAPAEAGARRIELSFFVAIAFRCYCDIFPPMSGTQVVRSLSYLNPGADFSASLVVLMVR